MDSAISKQLSIVFEFAAPHLLSLFAQLAVFNLSLAGGFAAAFRDSQLNADSGLTLPFVQITSTPHALLCWTLLPLFSKKRSKSD